MRTFSAEFAIVWSRLVVKGHFVPNPRNAQETTRPERGNSDRHSRQATDMCFEQHTCKIVFQSRKERRTLMLCATWLRKVRKLTVSAQELFPNPSFKQELHFAQYDKREDVFYKANFHLGQFHLGQVPLRPIST